MAEQKSVLMKTAPQDLAGEDIASKALPAVPTLLRARCLLWLAIAFSPFIFALATWSSNSGSPVAMIVAHYGVPIVLIELITITYALLKGVRPLQILLHASRLALSAMSLLAAVAIATAIFVAPVPAEAMIRTLTSLIHLLFGLSISALLVEHWVALRRWIWPSIVAGAVGYVAVLVLFVTSIEAPDAFNWGNFGLGVTNIRQTGFYATVGGAAAMGLAIGAQSRRDVSFWTVAASIFFALSFWSGTRSSLVAVPAATVTCFLLIPVAQRARTLAVLICSIATGALLSTIHSPPSGGFGWQRMYASVSSTDASSGRMLMWENAWELFLQRPIFGFGEGQFRYIAPEPWTGYNHPHNILLQLLVQWGAIGTLCVAALTLPLIFRAAGFARKHREDCLPAALVLCGLLIFSLYEGSLYHVYPVMMAVLSLAFILGQPHMKKQRD